MDTEGEQNTGGGVAILYKKLIHTYRPRGMARKLFRWAAANIPRSHTYKLNLVSITSRHGDDIYLGGDFNREPQECHEQQF
eukprot:9904230-Karenia_brevis.AAC.1